MGHLRALAEYEAEQGGIMRTRRAVAFLSKSFFLLLQAELQLTQASVL